MTGPASPNEQLSFRTRDIDGTARALADFLAARGRVLVDRRDYDDETVRDREFEKRPIRFFCVYADPGRHWVTAVESGGLAEPELAAELSRRIPCEALFLGLQESAGAWSFRSFAAGESVEGAAWPAAEGAPRSAHEFAWQRGLVTPFVSYIDLLDLPKVSKRKHLWIALERRKRGPTAP